MRRKIGNLRGVNNFPRPYSGWSLSTNLQRTLTGHFEVECGDVEDQMGSLCIVDVRGIRIQVFVCCFEACK